MIALDFAVLWVVVACPLRLVMAELAVARPDLRDRAATNSVSGQSSNQNDDIFHQSTYEAEQISSKLETVYHQ